MGPCFKIPIEQNFPDPNILTLLNRRPSGITEDEMFQSNESVKETLIEGSTENIDAFKIIKGKHTTPR